MKYSVNIQTHKVFTYYRLWYVECICSFSSLPLNVGELNAIVLINNRGRNKPYIENNIRFPMIESMYVFNEPLIW